MLVSHQHEPKVTQPKNSVIHLIRSGLVGVTFTIKKQIYLLQEETPATAKSVSINGSKINFTKLVIIR